MTADNWLVVGLGVGTVFVGLICIIFICSIMSVIIRKCAKPEAKTAPAAPVVTGTQVIPNRREFIAAVSAAIAEDMGTDIEAIRIVSVKKL